MWKLTLLNKKNPKILKLFQSYLSDHFLSNLEDLEAGLGAWIGIYINETGDFVYPDGSLAGWIPDQYFSRLVADFAVCLSINSGKVKNTSVKPRNTRKAIIVSTHFWVIFGIQRASKNKLEINLCSFSFRFTFRSRKCI